MFRDVDADRYVMVDGDHTYPVQSVMGLLGLVDEGADIAVGDRLSNGAYAKENKREFHELGNRLVLFLINRLYGTGLHDIMSGYRAFSRRFVKTYPALCEGFQLETDMTIFALSRKLRIAEMPIEYRDRPTGSDSKLNTYVDGLRVTVSIFNLYRFFHPLRFFGIVAIVCATIGVLVGFPVILEYLETFYVTKVPSAILASGLMTLSVLCISNGLILDSLKRSDQERFEAELKRR